MKVVVIKYNAGNIRSVLFALERIGVSAEVTDDPEKISSASKIIFPGVGEASSAMHYLKEKRLNTVIKNLKQPVLGICLGMQLLCNYSEEGNTDCLGIFPLHVRKFIGHGKVPQIGWNNIYSLEGKIFEGVKQNEFMYFVHGYYVELGNATIAKANYILEYSAALQHNNFYGVQFHPEKSSDAGQKLLENFLKL
jgi:glutamine amidotransferase